MGSRPSQFRKGGGRLNGVDVEFRGYEFTGDELVYEKGQSGFSRQEFKAGKIKGHDGKLKDKFHALNCLVSFRVDGATEDTVEPLFAGGADDFNISDDGLTIWDSNYDSPEAAAEAAEDPANKVRELGANTKFANFIVSLCEAGFPETNLPEDRINYEAIIGTRMRLIQREDPAMKNKTKKGKDGKERPYTMTVVDDVLGLPDAAPATPAAKAPAAKGKAAPAATTKAPAGKKAAAPVAEDTVDIDVETTAALLDALGQKSPLKVGDLSMWVLKNRMKHPQREAIRSRIVEPAFLAAVEGVVYNKTAKTLELVTEEVDA